MTVDDEFEILFRAYQRQITGYLCNLLSDNARGEELAQEVFVRAYRALLRGTHIEHPRAWLFKIATNVARDYFQRARLVHWLPFFGDERDPLQVAAGGRVAPSPADTVPEELAVRAALAQLKPEYRFPLLLHVAEGLSTAEIADVLGIGRSAVKMRLCRAREQFRAFYGEVKDSV